MSLLEVHGLRKTYAGRTVVDGVSFVVHPSEIVGLLGRNGAGKTTSFRMSIGMIDADDGDVLFNDHDVSGLPMYQRARLGMGYLSQEPSVFGRMSCLDNLRAILETLPLTRAQQQTRAAELLAQFGLTHKAAHPARTCSGGERRKLEIARALVTDPRIILLDEPFSGVDPIAVEDLQREIRRLASTGIACLITDHNVQQTLRVCDRAYIIDAGKVFAEGTPRELINNELVKRVYLGSLFRGDEFDPPAPASTRAATPTTPKAATHPIPGSTPAAAATTPGPRPAKPAPGVNGVGHDQPARPAPAAKPVQPATIQPAATQPAPVKPADPAKPRVVLVPTAPGATKTAPTITLTRSGPAAGHTPPAKPPAPRPSTPPPAPGASGDHP